ncbi:MAG: hypothetical protein L6428_00495 [Candidatus Aminicenantes bacterium]|nr:hypothetical protein [Candidatus Aminicenantes bacterium]
MAAKKSRLAFAFSLGRRQFDIFFGSGGSRRPAFVDFGAKPALGRHPAFARFFKTEPAFGHKICALHAKNVCFGFRRILDRPQACVGFHPEILTEYHLLDSGRYNDFNFDRFSTGCHGCIQKKQFLGGSGFDFFGNRTRGAQFSSRYITDNRIFSGMEVVSHFG